MEAKVRIEDELMPQRNGEAKDEMNLAEFPLCALAHRLNPEVKTLRFEDRIWDKGRNQFIARKLTITGSDAYGLPTEKDDEVLLGLIQLTRAHGFAERKVPFTRHELIRILGWRDDSKSYARIEESLNRWTGVTLYYDNAWWNKDRKCWMNEKFHILDNVWLCHRGQPTPDTGLLMIGAPQSAFVWNETIFRSFTHGNLKSIDFEFYKSLKSAVAKRLYRFLDKHFYKRNRIEMDLRELCCEHIGLSRNYDTANMKRKLLSGVRELEERQFLQKVSGSQMFEKIKKGVWSVRFHRIWQSTGTTNVLAEHQNDQVVNALVEFGVEPAVALRTVAEYPRDRILEKLKAFGAVKPTARFATFRNPAGYLLSAIRSDYFLRSSGVERQSSHHPGNATVQPRRHCRKNAEDRQDNQLKRQRITDFWSSLSEEERKKCECAALAEATPFQRVLIERDKAFARATKDSILDAFALRLMAQANDTPTK